MKGVHLEVQLDHQLSTNSPDRPAAPRRLLDQLRDETRLRHYSLRTEARDNSRRFLCHARPGLVGFAVPVQTRAWRATALAGEIVSAKRSDHLPVVLTPGEVRMLLNELRGVSWLACALLYGTGMRLLEGLRLRVKDVVFERQELIGACRAEPVDAASARQRTPVR